MKNLFVTTFIITLVITSIATSASAASIVRQNYHLDVESRINEQINIELSGSYAYMSMGHFFARDDQAMHGFSKFFLKCSEEDQQHAKLLMEYQNMRGGTIVLNDIKAPEESGFKRGVLEAVEEALQREKSVNEALLELHKKASDEHKDVHTENFLEENFLDEQVKSIKQLSDMVTRLQRAGTGLGKIIVDQQMQDSTS